MTATLPQAALAKVRLGEPVAHRAVRRAGDGHGDAGDRASRSPTRATHTHAASASTCRRPTGVLPGQFARAQFVTGTTRALAIPALGAAEARRGDGGLRRRPRRPRAAAAGARRRAGGGRPWSKSSPALRAASALRRTRCRRGWPRPRQRYLQRSRAGRQALVPDPSTQESPPPGEPGRRRTSMAHIVILGAGIGGMPMAYEMRELARRDDTVTVVSNSPQLPLRPVQSRGSPSTGASARTSSSTIAPCAQAEGHRLHPGRRQARASGREPDRTGRRQQHRLRLPGHRHRPEAGLRRSRGPGPEAATRSSICHVDHAVEAGKAWEQFVKDPGPDRRRRRAGRFLLRPGLRVRHDHGHRPAPAQDPRQGADDLRHRRTLHRPPRPRRRRRLQGHDGIGAARPAHQVDLQRQGRPRSRPARCSSPSTTTTASRRRNTNCRSSTR